jgi:hypothetical protein
VSLACSIPCRPLIQSSGCLPFYSLTSKLLITKLSQTSFGAQRMVKGNSHSRQPSCSLAVSSSEKMTPPEFIQVIIAADCQEKQISYIYIQVSPTSPCTRAASLSSHLQCRRYSCMPVEASSLDYSMPRSISASCSALQSRLTFAANDHLTRPTQRVGSNTRAGYRVHRTRCMELKQAIARFSSHVYTICSLVECTAVILK